MTREDFVESYSKLVNMALASGIRHGALPFVPGPDKEFNWRQHREFISRCHRGYEKAQDYAVQMVQQILAGTESPSERDWQLFHIRKVMDAIAYTILGGHSYVIRRLSTHGGPPAVDMRVLRNANEEARRRNRMSRLTFSLLADLTTSIHVADLLTIDFRVHPAKVDFVELKSGRVNTMLLSQLEHYAPTEEAIGKIDDDTAIAAEHKAQAKRMLRQRVRLARIDEIILTDKGIEPSLKMPLRLSKDFVVEDSYDDLIDDLLTTAQKEGGRAAASYAWCLHFGTAKSDDPETAKRRAAEAAMFAAHSHYESATEEVRGIIDEVRALIPPTHSLRLVNVVQSNLAAVSARPFPIWAISPENRLELVSQRMALAVAFDIGGFIAMGRSLDIPMRLSTRKEAARLLNGIPRHEKLTWGNRALLYTLDGHEITALSGMFSRFVNDLTNPVQFLRDAKRVGIDVPQQRDVPAAEE